MIDRTRNILVITLLAVMCLIPSTDASVFEKGKHIEISRLHTIDDDFYGYGDRLTLDGSITGDALLFVANCDINGEVNGSVQVFTQNMLHNGSIDGALRTFSYRTVISGFVGRSVETFSAFSDVNRGAVIGRDYTAFSEQIRMGGTIRGDARLTGEDIRIDGTIEGNAILHGEKIIIAPPAVIQGDLIWESKDSSALVIEPGVTVLGERTWKRAETDDDDAMFDATGIILQIAGLLAAFIFGIIVVRIFQPYAREADRQLRTRFAASMATGAVTVFALAVSIFILVLALLGLLVGTILVGSGGAVVGGLMVIVAILLLPITSFLSVSGLIIFYSGKIIAAFVLGGLISKRGDGNLMAGPLLLGLVVLTIVFAVPYLGTLLYIVTGVVGAGAIVLGIRYCQPANKVVPGASEKPDTTPPQ